MNTVSFLFCLLAAGGLLLAGCAQTTVYRDGRPLFRSQANAAGITFRDGSTYFHADTLDHSTPTAAGGQSAAKIIQSGATAATAIGGAVATQGFVQP